jgi:sugar-specific transcriptional regulator TrmB
VFEEKEQTLELLGLSPTQAHVYLTLIRLGKTSAKILAKQSGVACPDIYRIMNSFEKIGLIQRIIEHPKKYEAIEIEQALPILLKHKREETKEIEKKIREFIREIKQEQHTKKIPDADSDLLLLPATKFIVQKRMDEMRNTTNCIESVISFKVQKELMNQNLFKLTKKMIEKGVRCRLIIENPRDTNLLTEDSVLKIINKNGSKIKFIKNNPLALFTIYDKKEATIYTSNKAGLYDTPLLWTNNDSIIAILTGYFEYLWEKTEEQDKPSFAFANEPESKL